MTETIDLAPGHRLVITSGPDGDRYSCSCGKLTGGDVEAAHYHSDLVTP